MNKRGIIILSTLFGLFALSFGVLGVRALTLGPDPAQPTESQLVARTMAANQLEQQINAAKADVPPALPPMPERTARASGAGAMAATPAPQAQAPQYYDEDYEEYEEDDGEEHEEEYEHEGEGDHDDD